MCFHGIIVLVLCVSLDSIPNYFVYRRTCSFFQIYQLLRDYCVIIMIICFRARYCPSLKAFNNQNQPSPAHKVQEYAQSLVLPLRGCSLHSAKIKFKIAPFRSLDPFLPRAIFFESECYFGLIVPLQKRLL